MPIIRLLILVSTLSLLVLANPANGQQRIAAFPRAAPAAHEFAGRDHPLAAGPGSDWALDRQPCAATAPQSETPLGALSTMGRGSCARRVGTRTLQGATVGLGIFSVYALAVCLPKVVGGGDSSCPGTQATLLTVGGAAVGGLIGLFSEACKRREPR